jgi:hypothetical protein
MGKSKKNHITIKRPLHDFLMCGLIGKARKDFPFWPFVNRLLYTLDVDANKTVARDDKKQHP